jgi:hypothetical protein
MLPFKNDKKTDPKKNGPKYKGTDKSLSRHTSRYILFDGENIFLMLVLLYI